MNAITSTAVLWANHNPSLALSKSLNYCGKAADIILFWAVTIAPVVTLERKR